jgi:FkbM family methyltransferase
MYLKKQLETYFHRIIRKTGYDVVKCKYSKHELGIEELLKVYQIGAVLDIGANIGQYGKYLRIDGYENQIISFEPIKHVFTKLEAAIRNDAKWKAYNFAIGDYDGISEINISGNLVSSSIMPIKEAHIEAASDSAYISKEEIEVKKLDTIFNDLDIKDKRIYMKIDTQGFEYKVLKGAFDSLKHIDTLQIEMAVQPLYEGEELYHKISDFLYGQDYRLIKIVRGLTKANGELLQFDGVFHRN